jgi:dUTP pyrophosphatase
MEVKIKRVDRSLELPKYETAGSAFFDLLVREEVRIEAGEIGFLPLNIIVQTPKGYFLLLVPRSSTPIRHGLLIPNGIGVIDPDYQGDEDEIKLLVYNFTKKPVVVKRGERIAQAGFVPVEKVKWSEVMTMPAQSRGGFGSTG